MWPLEPGPLQFLDPARFPRPGVLVPDNETTVAPHVEQFLVAEQHTGTRQSEIIAGGMPDVDGETAAALRPMLEEMAEQHATAHELSTSETVREAVRTLDEIGQVAGDLPAEDSEYDPPEVPGEGENAFPTSTDIDVIVGEPETQPLP